MSLKDTYKHLKDLLAHITADLEKSENGNKAASQRVRTGTVKLEKIAKAFRKESISSEKKNKGVKKPAKAARRKHLQKRPQRQRRSQQLKNQLLKRSQKPCMLEHVNSF